MIIEITLFKGPIETTCFSAYGVTWEEYAALLNAVGDESCLLICDGITIVCYIESVALLYVSCPGPREQRGITLAGCELSIGAAEISRYVDEPEFMWN